MLVFMVESVHLSHRGMVMMMSDDDGDSGDDDGGDDGGGDGDGGGDRENMLEE